MLNLKDRILLLQSRTKSEKAVKLCNDAMKACTNKLLESTVSGQLIDNLSSEVSDPAVKQFVTREARLNKVQNLGVRESYNELCASELSFYPTVKPVLDRMRISIQTTPEYVIAEQYAATLDSMSWFDLAKKSAENVRKNINENKEDIFLCNFLYESAQTGSYLLPAFRTELDNYFVNRDTESRNALIEKVRPYAYADPRIATLAGMLEEKAGGVTVKADGSVSIDKIYSPVISNNGATIFCNEGRFFAKTKDSLVMLSESQVADLPREFVELCASLNADNVKISESKIDIYTRTKTVSINPDSNIVKVDGRPVDFNVFSRSFMNEGLLYGASMNNELSQITRIYENASTLCEIDFGKHLVSNTYKGHEADIYRFGDTISVYESNKMFGTSKFFTNLTATQTRNMLIEHLNYDIKDSFCDLSEKENARVEKYKAEKSELEANLTHMKLKKEQIMEAVKVDPYLRNSKDIDDLLESLDCEITKTEDEVLTRTNLIKNITSTSTAPMFECGEFNCKCDGEGNCDCPGKETVVDEPDADDDGDTVEPMDDPNELTAGDEVQLKNGALGVVQGFQDDGENCILLMHDGKTVSVAKEFLNEITVIKKKSQEEKPEIKEEEPVVEESAAAVCPVCGQDPCVCQKAKKAEKIDKSADPTPNSFAVKDSTNIPAEGTMPKQEVTVTTVQPTIADGKVEAQLVDDAGNIVMDKIYVDAQLLASAAENDKITYMTSTNSQDVFTTAKKYVKTLV